MTTAQEEQSVITVNVIIVDNDPVKANNNICDYMKGNIMKIDLSSKGRFVWSEMCRSIDYCLKQRTRETPPGSWEQVEELYFAGQDIRKHMEGYLIDIGLW